MDDFYAPLFFAPPSTTLLEEPTTCYLAPLYTRKLTLLLASVRFEGELDGVGLGGGKFVLYFNYILRILMRHFICCSFGMCPRRYVLPAG